MKSDVDRRIDQLDGKHLISVDKLDYTWAFRFTGDITIATESLWRLLQGRIVVTSEDHLQQFGLAEPVDAVHRVLETTSGRSVDMVAISASTGDLVIEFGGGVQLQFLQTSLGYEAWRLSLHGTEIICTGGGDIVHR